MPISEWPEDQRPRERLLAHGASALTDAELLAVYLRVGSRGRSAVDLGRDCLERFGGLGGLFAATLQDFGEIAGFGPAKFAQLQAVLELAKRALRAELVQAPVFSSPRGVRDYLQLQLSGLPYEAFFVMFLDVRHRLLASEEMFRGTLTQTAVYPREIVRRALARNAASVILAHNHPSGSTEPSQADRALTDAVRRALETVDIRVLDHVIVGAAATASFAELGLL